ncbi:sensor histidine kinase [Amycolatopsis benzoatilytica]|uniref:sensor histidine kinase n=1 Tax=Amycolatopsis benzoatilytica TaxID=346045 RepID=UPI000365887B|nr:sensor histidine kinase [Amycolatopsis benzoatilytica]
MSTPFAAARRRFERADWVRWGVLAIPTVFAIPHARPVAWPLIVLLLALSVPALLLTKESQPRWLLPTVMIVIVAAAGTLWIIQSGAWTSATMFGGAFYTLRVSGRVAASLALGASAVAVAIWAIVHSLDLLNTLALFGVLAVMILLAANRRGRAERLEQTELALARAQTASEEHARAAALAERTRIARELHDVLAHSLAGLALNLQGARLMMVRDGASEESLAQIERAQRLASDGLAEARKAVAALREDAVPVERAVSDLLAAYRLDTGSRADLVIEGEPRDLDATLGTTLVRAVQEALANSRKHAGGAAVDVKLAYADNDVELTIADRQGRRPPDPPAPGYGLRGMSERVALLNGMLECGPGEDGWRIHLTVPA